MLMSSVQVRPLVSTAQISWQMRGVGITQQYVSNAESQAPS